MKLLNKMYGFGVKSIIASNLFFLAPGLNAEPISKDIKFFQVKNPAQKFAYAGKLHWNNRKQQWDRVIVAYNNAPNADKTHPVWKYVSQLKPPASTEKHQYNLHYKVFHLTANCTTSTPLAHAKVWRINFDKHPLGSYTYSKVREDWNCPEWTMGNNLVSVVGKEKAFQGHALRIHYPKYAYGCKDSKQCVNWKPKIGGQFNQIYYSYKIKLAKGFDFVKGGKLPGIAGGTANTAGKKPNGRDGWSVRMMWNRHGKLVQYVYHPDQKRAFGDSFEWEMSVLDTEKWHTIKTRVRMNRPSKHDGLIQSWLNGKLVLDRRNLRFRDNQKLQIDRFMFASFYGGSDASWAPKRDQAIYLDEFILSVKEF